MNATQNLTQVVGLLFENSSASYPGMSTFAGSSGNLNYTVWNKTLGTLSFDPSKTNYHTINRTVNELFRPEVFSYYQPCAYAISGNYGFLPRLLYYVLLIFALILRKHTWLSPAALGVAMTYAATSCVHAFALLTRYKYHYLDYSNPDQNLSNASNYGDADLWGILPILITGCIMITPILNWSVTVRERGFRPVVVYWGILMFSALLATVIRLLHKNNGLTPFVVETQLATCVLDEKLDCTMDYIYKHNLTTSWNSYNKCQCNDTCGAVSITGIPFRKDTGVQAWLVRDKTTALLETNSYIIVYAINLLFLAFIVCQGILGLIESQWTPAEIRNWIFRITGGTDAYHTRTFASKSRYYFGKVTAGNLYIWTVLGAIICPAVFVSSVITDEILAWGYPVNESFDAIGQWSTWVGALFVILTAIIQRYHTAWVHSVALGLRTLLRLAKWCCGKAPLRAEPTKALRTKENSAAEDTKELFRQCAIPIIYAAESLAISWQRVTNEWHDFAEWRHDPVASSTARPQDREKHALPRYHRALSDQRDAEPHTKASAAANLQSTTSVSSLEPADLSPREQTPQPISRWHQSPLPPEQDSPTMEPEAQAPAAGAPQQPDPAVPPVPPKSLERRSTDGLARRTVRYEVPRRGSEDAGRGGVSPGPATSWLHDL